jgi:hypothetical protein
VGGNYSPSGRSRLGRYAHPGEHGQVSGRVSYHQAKDIKITVEVPAIAHMEGSPAPTPRQRDQMEQAVRDAEVASVHRQWEEHQGEEAAIEARAAQDAKAALPPGVSGMVRVDLSVGGPTAREYALPSVDYHLGGPSDCYVEVDVPTKDFAYRAKTERSTGSGSTGGHVGSTSTESQAGVAVGGTSTSQSSRTTATDVKLKQSQERRTKILTEYQKSVSTSFTRDFTRVWEKIATEWESGSGMSQEKVTERPVSVSIGPGAEEQLKKQSDEEKDPSLWERAKRAVKGFLTTKLKGWIADKAEKILGKNIVFRVLPGARKWVARTLTDLGWKAGEWLWDKITGTVKADHEPERDVTQPDAQNEPIERQREIVRQRLQYYAFTTSEFSREAGKITTHFQKDVDEAVRRSLEVEFGHSSSVDVRSTSGTGRQHHRQRLDRGEHEDEAAGPACATRTSCSIPRMVRQGCGVGGAEEQSAPAGPGRGARSGTGTASELSRASRGARTSRGRLRACPSGSPRTPAAPRPWCS